MSLKGNLESIFFASVLQLLCNDKKSGVLRVWEDKNEVRIFLDEGVIIYATSSQKELRLGYLLRQKGLISKEELRECLKPARANKQALGKIIVEKGFVSLENLEKFIHQKVEETLYGLFRWKKGNFEYKETKLNLEGHILTHLDTMELIIEASWRADKMSAQ